MIRSNRAFVALALSHRFGETLLCHPLPEADVELRVFPCREHDPRFGLSVIGREVPPGKRLVGVCLDRKPDRAVQHLHQDAQIVPLPEHESLLGRDQVAQVDLRPPHPGDALVRVPAVPVERPDRGGNPFLGLKPVLIGVPEKAAKQLSAGIHPGDAVALEKYWPARDVRQIHTHWVLPFLPGFSSRVRRPHSSTCAKACQRSVSMNSSQNMIESIDMTIPSRYNAAASFKG